MKTVQTLMIPCYNSLFMMKFFVAEYFSLHTANSKEDIALSPVFTENEMNAMRYACGYVPHALLKNEVWG